MYKNQLMEENPFFNFDALLAKFKSLSDREGELISKEQKLEAIWNAIETINDALWDLKLSDALSDYETEQLLANIKRHIADICD